MNFRGLPSGDYTIDLVDQHGSHQEKVVYRPAYVLKSIHVGRIRQADDKFLLAVANAQHEPVLIRIYDAHQRLVHSESKVVKGNFAQVYSILDKQGHYTFEVYGAHGHRKYFVF